MPNPCLDAVELDQLRKLSEAGNLSPGVQVKLEEYIAKRGTPEIASATLINPRAPAAIPEVPMGDSSAQPASVDVYGVTPEPAYGGGSMPLPESSPPSVMLSPRSPTAVPSTASETQLQSAVKEGQPISLPELVSEGASAPVVEQAEENKRSRLGDAYSMQQMGVLAESKALGQGFKERAESMERGIESMDRLEARRQEAEIERQQQWNDELSKFKSAVSDFNELQVDPNRYWKNAGTGSKILWGL